VVDVKWGEVLGSKETKIYQTPNTTNLKKLSCKNRKHVNYGVRGRLKSIITLKGDTHAS
jgi:hypothetical protein